MSNRRSDAAERIMGRGERESRRDSFLLDAEDSFAARPGYPAVLLEEAVELGADGIFEGVQHRTHDWSRVR